MLLWVWVVVCASAGQLVAARQVMVGQPRQVSVNNTEVLTAARFAVVQFDKDNAQDLFAYKIVNIKSAKIQVVAGVNYILDVELGRTMCLKNATFDREACVYHSEPKELLCRFIITEIPWADSCVLTQEKCHPQNSIAK